MAHDWSTSHRTVGKIQRNGVRVRRLTIHERLVRDPRSTDELFTIALDERREGYGRGSAHEALITLHARATPDVLERAISLCRSTEAAQRILGARVLGELGNPPRAFPETSGAELLRLVADDPDIDVVVEAIYALGHLGHTSAEDPLIIALHDHQDERVRRGVAFTLCGRTSTESVQALLNLMRDPEPEVRDWATTGIGGTIAIDGPEIREALLLRATDEDKITRAEALHGLARRHDERVVPYLLEELEAPQELSYLFENVAKCHLGLPEDKMFDGDFLRVALRYQGSPYENPLWRHQMATFSESGTLTKEIEAFFRDFNRGCRNVRGSARIQSLDRAQTEAAISVMRAIATIDRIFASRQISDTVEYCDHCTNAEYVAYLRSTPRDKLSEDEVFSLVADLTNTFGGEIECTWLAPRLLRDGLGVPSYDVELAMSRLRRARSIWSGEEIKAVNFFLSAQWLFVLQTMPLPNGNSLSYTSTLLNASAQLGFLESALDLFRHRNDRTSDARLLELLDDPDSFDSYGTIQPDAYRTLQAWLRSPQIANRTSSLIAQVAIHDEHRAKSLKTGLAKLQGG